MSIEALLRGYRRFRTTRYAQARELYEQLQARGQRPKVLFIACCDSRADPAAITDSGPGELFVIRNVANLVPPCTPDGGHHGTSAAVEFAVRHLEVEHIVVMGHAECGGAKALMQGAGDDPAPGDFIGQWIALAQPARNRVLAMPRLAPDGHQRAIEQEIVRLSLENLLSFGWLRERVEAGRLSLHGWHFGIATGSLRVLEPASGEFHPLG